MSKTDYDLNLIRGVAFDVDGVLSPVCVPMDENGIPRRMANLRDGYAIQLAVRKGLKIAIITGGNDPAIVGRFCGLGIDRRDIRMITGRKLPELLDWMERNALTPEQVAYVGDDIPDLECMQAAGLAVAPNDAARQARDTARYVTVANGGHGVARELLEQILTAQNNWPDTADANGR